MRRQGLRILAIGLSIGAVLTGCTNIKTNTDPTKDPPTARLEVYATKPYTGRATLTSLVVEGGEGRVAPRTAELAQGIMIRAIGGQLDRGLGLVNLTISGKDIWCHNDARAVAAADSSLGPVPFPASNSPGSPVGVLIVETALSDFMNRAQCDPDMVPDEGVVVIGLTVTNVAGLHTSTPDVTLNVGSWYLSQAAGDQPWAAGA
jgi:hypothetical protein